MTPRASNRGAAAGKGRADAIVQRPAKRERGATSTRSRSGRLRSALRFAPLAVKIMLAVVAGYLIFTGYRAAASASFFQVRTLDVSGASRVPADDIRAVVRRTVSKDGVWNADLDAVSKEIVERLPWVRTAVVSRVMPDGLRVRVTERVPRAVVRNSSGKLTWVDEDAVVLGAMSATDHMPAFFMRGWDDSKTDLARTENSERVRKFLEMSRDWEALGLSERVSEVNLADLKDVRAQLAGNDSQVEIWLGKEDFGNRLKRALETLDEQRQTPRGPFITHVNVSQGLAKGGPPITIGVSPNAQSLVSNAADDSSSDTHAGTAKKNETSSIKGEQKNRSREAKPKTGRKDDEKQKKRERDKKDTFAEGTKTRPRRIG